jgi:hypothetical protein
MIIVRDLLDAHGPGDPLALEDLLHGLRRQVRAAGVGGGEQSQKI